ncbi:MULTISPECIES: response regulator [unclassified Colwellia]|jgi:two-component system response regulator QseB|uniref:response regulator n=1 Tax=unclassified Colwellia TaxID=196834 RepID=UPI0015F6CABA|nr:MULTISPECIES: response regulator [unclassified Colwellia]MBA6350960.1 response regulator [Colwellia sp. BRX9-1]MBA6356925.1 response regulator [Colwellia sp. BRX8-3]MBA6360837.1 response regulator [Colwellia sp. BRX8-6]MBA6368956.1 response regulator [Colwellia sp. BRX8-5]MBA6374810.1 response regulator [Colwellia sp. BRX8-2]
MRILIVEDDKIIGDGLVQCLLMDNYAVDWVETKESAETALLTTPYDLLLLDIGLPDGSGLDVLKKLRRDKNDVPVLILTAYDETPHKVEGLDAGADDYLVKPFDLDELCARIRALQRRASGRGTPLFKSANIILDPATHKVTQAGETVRLGPKEFAILQTLMEKPGLILSKAQIQDKLYGWNMETESNTIEVHIHGIRRKLGKSAVITVRHVGYHVAE